MNLSRPEGARSTTSRLPLNQLAPGAILSRAHTMRVLLVGLLLLGAGLRFQGLFGAGLHADEALFASWARAIAVWRDPLLQLPVVDKPPLLFYVQALFFPLVGVAEPWVARLPNLLASLLMIPLMARLVWLLYRDWLAAAVAALFVAFSPLAVQLSPSAFTDPLLTCLLLASLVAAAGAGRGNNRGVVAGGLLFGLASCTKYQAWLFLPLLLGLLWLRRLPPRQFARWAFGAGLPLLALVAWNLVRSGTLSLWALQMESYGGLRLAWSWELWPRLETWAQQWQLVWGSPILAFFLILGLPLFLALLISEQDWSTAYDQMFVVFIGAYALLHWVVAVPVWDRYLLPIVPLVALLLGRFISRVLSFLAPGLPLSLRRLQGGALLAAFLLLAPAALQAGQGARDHGAAGAGAGAAQVAAQLQDEPYGTVLYDHWYSWYWRYYLFDSGVYVSWFAHPAALVQDLQAFGHTGPARYLALPTTDAARPVLRALQDAGFSLEEVREAGDVILYKVVGTTAHNSLNAP